MKIVEKFDINKAKDGSPIYTFGGRPVRIICYDRKTEENKYPIIGLIYDEGTQCERLIQYKIDGTQNSCVYEYNLCLHPKKKLYLSGPMSLCKDKETFLKIFQYYEELFTDNGYEVVNPAKNPIFGTYEECLKNAIKQELECDAIFFLPNSILSNGAILERSIAKGCGLEIVVLDDDISFENNYETQSGIKAKNS